VTSGKARKIESKEEREKRKIRSKEKVFRRKLILGVVLLINYRALQTN
jgi:hypothetical protein